MHNGGNDVNVGLHRGQISVLNPEPVERVSKTAEQFFDRTLTEQIGNMIKD
jgi:hypothetical protein